MLLLKKYGDAFGDFQRAQHTDLDTCGGDVGCEVVEDLAEEVGVYGLKVDDSLSGLNG